MRCATASRRSRRRIDALKARGCERILIAPLYPQYCAATTATANDEAFAHLRRMRWQPAVRTLPPYHDDPAYIAALRRGSRRGWRRSISSRRRSLASFHGMPQRTLELGDPYHCHCRKTARLLAEASGRELIVAFQSRFGRAKWLEPATDVDAGGAARRRASPRSRSLAPGFAADCLETLEELAIRGRDTFLAAGGSDFAYLPCLNDSPAGHRHAAQHFGAASLKAGWPRAVRAAHNEKSRREEWHALRSSPAAREALARRSASPFATRVHRRRQLCRQ